MNCGNKIWRLLNKNTLTAFNWRMLKELVYVGVEGVITVKTEAAEIRRPTAVWVSGQHVCISV